ncbi:transglutaminase family protein [Hydrogenophaga luteola]|uniref:Transglutaminase domain-containing protein n=1 Tax=Hydrogenophaga luteola TaxID=1591122 RepID=A0ABV7W692_9BURK
MIYDIVHTTEYRFQRPVTFGLHRLTFRPRDSHDMRVLATNLEVSPRASRTSMVHDVYGNSVVLLQPDGPADSLLITSRFSVEHLGSVAFVAGAESAPGWMPPDYTSVERLALTPFLLPSFEDPTHQVRTWAQGFVGADGSPRQIIEAMCDAIRSGFRYAARDEEGTQAPAQTLAMGSGACRDFATLMIDALRRLGIAARFVSGFVYSPAQDGIQGGGATHGWVQVYLPDGGWFPVDPTNNLIGGSDLIRIAVAREATEVPPLTGQWFGVTDDYIDMRVDVQVQAR